MPLVKDIAVLFLILLGIPVFTMLFCVWRGGRRIGFFCLVIGCVYTYSMDLNMVSREWYRGSTRGFEISAVDILAAGLLASMILRPVRGHRRWYWPVALLPMLIYLGVCLFSVMITSPKLFGMFELLKVFRGIIIFLTGAMFLQGLRELKTFVWAIIFMVIWEGLLCLKLHYTGVYRVPGSFDHPNSLSMFMVLCAPILYAAAVSDWSGKIRFLSFIGIGLASAAVIMTVSRTGVVVLGMVLMLTAASCFTFKMNFQNIVITSAVVLVLGAGVAYAWPTLMERFKQASMGDEYTDKGGAMNRGSYLKLAGLIRRDHPFGIGLNNWSYAVTDVYGPIIGLPYKPYEGTDDPPDQQVDSGMVDPTGTPLDDAQAPPAHNLGALTLGEMGWPGIFALGLMWCSWLWAGFVFLWRRPTDPLRRIGIGIFFGVIAVTLQSWTEWEYRQTPIMFIFHLILGCLAGLYQMRKDDSRWERRERRRLQREADQGYAT